MLFSCSIAPALACVLLTAPVGAQTISLPSVADNTLYEDELGALSSGAGTGIFAGRVSATGMAEIRRGLIRFDPSSAIPPGSIITGATLRLYMNKTMAGEVPVAIHRTLAGWGEGTSVGEGTGGPATPGDATWVHRFYDTALWTAAGGDFAVTPSASTLVGAPEFYQWSGPLVVADVQAWLDDPASNFGWTILGDESATKTAKRFGSREWFFPSERPALVIEFIAPACYADCDGDASLTIDDFICFQTSFALGDAYADCDGDASLTIDDFVCFQTWFAIGC